MFAKYLFILLAALTAGKGCESSSDVSPPPKTPPPQTAAEKQKLDEILTRWEQATAGTENFRYEFRRWQYDPKFGPKETFRTYSEGIIEISMPDKWYFRTDRVLECQRASSAEAKLAYFPADDQHEEWSYDGDWVSYADRYHRAIVRTEMPPDSERGLTCQFWKVYGDDESRFGEPLRWLAQFDRDAIEAKYHLRLLPLGESDQDYKIEAIPKNPGWFSHATTVILDRDSCLPKAGVLFDSPHSTSPRKGRTVYEFTQGDPRVHECADFVVSQVQPRKGWIVDKRHWHKYP